MTLGGKYVSDWFVDKTNGEVLSVTNPLMLRFLYFVII